VADFDLIVRGGRVVTDSDIGIYDVGVKDGVITEIGAGLTGSNETLDAAGKLLLPGGIDAHCHLSQLSSFGVQTADDFTSGSLSAACGGTTTIIPFAPQQKGESLRDAVDTYAKKAEGRSVLDYGFNLIISDPTPTVLNDELPGLVAAGHTAIKIFMTYDSVRLDDRQILNVLQAAKDLGVMTMVHAENHDMIMWNANRLVSEGKTAPKYHAQAHPPESEREAVYRIIALAESVGAPLYIVHLSDREAIAETARAQQRGVAVTGETCPQYLVLTEADLDKPGFEGAKFICSPPLRSRADQDAVWAGLESGVLLTCNSDHAGYRFDDPTGKKVRGDEAAFPQIPNGVPGLETRLPILFSEGVRQGRISLRRFVELSASNPARIFGLYPSKGVIAVGSDADLVLWDETLRSTISIDGLHDNMDYTPYQGLELEGYPVTTVSRGKIVWHEGRALGMPGWGELLHRDKPRHHLRAGER